MTSSVTVSESGQPIDVITISVPGLQGPAGPKGDPGPAGAGLPAGGAKEQIIVHNGTTTEWRTSHPAHRFTPGSPGTGRQWIRLLTINGVSGTTGATYTGVLSGAGDTTDIDKTTSFIHLTQRGDNTISAKVWSLDTENSVNPPAFHTKQISTYVFELWVQLGSNNNPQTLTHLSISDTARVTFNFDGATTTAPTGLTAATARSISQAIVDVDSAASAATANALVRRAADGSATFSTVTGNSTPTAAGHLTRKDYVDTGLGGKANTSHTHVATTDLTATGTKDSTTFLRGDNTWAVPAGTGGGGTADTAAIRRLPRRSIDTSATDDITLALTDEGHSLEFFGNGASPTVTIPTNAVVGFTEGAWIQIGDIGAVNPITIVPAAGVTLRKQDGADVVDNYGFVRVRKVGTDTWQIDGHGYSSTAAAANTVVRRDATGSIHGAKVSAADQPAVAQDLTRKDYVDTQITNNMGRKTFTIPNLGTRQYIRLARIDGTSAGTGAHVAFLLGGQGDYGNVGRATMLVHFTQRGDNIANANVWSFGADGANNPPELYTRQISTYVFELWGYFPFYPIPNQHMVSLASHGTTALYGDSATSTAPTGLSAAVARVEVGDPGSNLREGDNISFVKNTETGTITIHSTASGGGVGVVDLSVVPAGYVHVHKKNGGVWEPRPSTRTDIVVAWAGADPDPAVVIPPSTDGAYDSTNAIGDVRWVQ